VPKKKINEEVVLSSMTYT